jgi:hypothetical protein
VPRHAYNLALNPHTHVNRNADGAVASICMPPCGYLDAGSDASTQNHALAAWAKGEVSRKCWRTLHKGICPDSTLLWHWVANQMLHFMEVAGYSQPWGERWSCGIQGSSKTHCVLAGSLYLERTRHTIP